MKAAEVVQGLERLGIIHYPTLEHSPYQNGKQEVFWTQVEGRLLPMLESVEELTLSLLNKATQAWLELEYNQKIHSEIGQTPLARYLAGPDLARTCPSSDHLRLVFGLQESRIQRRSDGTVSIDGRRFEIPSRCEHLREVVVRYARWDYSRVHLIDPRTDVVLCRIWPQDKTANADRMRRKRAPGPLADLEGERPAEKSTEIAPLLRKLMAEYAATGLPPAYIPKEEAARGLCQDDEEETR
jgi:putative transposase